MTDARILTIDNPTGEQAPALIITPANMVVEYAPQWAPWVRQFIGIMLVFGCIIGIIFLGPIAQILIASFLLALLMYLPARLISKRSRLPYKGAVSILYIFVVALVIFGVTQLTPVVSRGIGSISTSAERYLQEGRTFFKDYDPQKTPEKGYVYIFGLTIDANPALTVVRDVVFPEQAPVDPNAKPGTTPPKTPINLQSPGFSLPNIDYQTVIAFITATATGLLAGIAGLASTLLLALFISFLILIELPSYRQGFMNLIPTIHHREINLLTRRILKVWVGFFRGQLIVGIIIGVLTWLQLTVMGISGALPLAILVAVISLIPNIGGIIALAPLAIVPLLQGSSVFTSLTNGTVALLVVGVNLVISQVIWNVVAPSIIGDAISLPLPVIIVGVFFGTAIGGIVGAFLIAPILGTLRLVVMYLLMKIGKQDPFPGETWTVQEA